MYTMKISGPLVKALNNQISMEANAAHAYLAAGSWCEITGYDGSAAFFYAQAEDGIRDSVASRGLGDVYKRQLYEELWTKLLVQIFPLMHYQTYDCIIEVQFRTFAVSLA